MLQVAQIQFAPRLGDLDYNLKRVAELLKQAAAADLVVIPELANSGYNFTGRSHALELASGVGKSDFTEMLRETSRRQNQYIVSGFLESEDEELFNTSLLFSPGGSIEKYRKIHLFLNEKDIFSKGNLGLPVFEVNGFKMGMLICFDYLFPEVWRIMALKGADLIAHPSNLVTYKAFKVVPAQATINRIFIFTTNRTGADRGLSFSGRSFAVDPEGEIIGEASVSDEEVLLTTIDPVLARNKMLTERNHVLNDRFPEDYRELL